MINETFLTNSTNTTNTTDTTNAPTTSPSTAGGLSQTQLVLILLLMFLEGLSLLKLYLKYFSNSNNRNHCAATYIVAVLAGVACTGAVIDAYNKQKLTMKDALIFSITAYVAGFTSVIGLYYAGKRLAGCCNKKGLTESPQRLLFSTSLPPANPQVAPRDSSDALVRGAVASPSTSVPSVPTVTQPVSRATTNTLSMA